MKVAVTSYGTEGDLRPMVALGLALRAAGHQMVLAAEPGGQALAERHGITFVPLPPSLRERIGDDQFGAHVRRGRTNVAGIIPVARLLDEHLHGWTTALLEAAPDADVVLASGFALPSGFTAADALGVPAVAVFLQPFTPRRPGAAGRGSAPGSVHPSSVHRRSIEPSLIEPSAMMPPELPARLQPALFAAGTQAAWLRMRGAVNGSRRRLGLPPRRRLWSGYPELHAWSGELAPAGTGDWPLAAGDARLDDALLAFLDAGEPPVHVGFGSMPLPPGLLHTVLAGLGSRRVVLAPGWSGEHGDALSGLGPRVHVVGHVPHHLLLPRMAAVVHHCGAGTSHAVVRAGVPSIPVPLTADQPFWAERLHQLGLGTRPVRAQRATAAQIASRLDEVDALRPAARDAAARLGCEDGPAAAVAQLEALLG